MLEDRLDRIEVQLASIAERQKAIADRQERHFAWQHEQESRVRKLELFDAKVIGISLLFASLPGMLLSWLLHAFRSS